MSRPRRHIWCELVPHARLRDRQLLDALCARNIQLLLAITPERCAGAADAVRACRDRGVAIGVWPMIADADGRWASTHNADRFASYTRALMDQLDAADALPDEVVLDLEPPIQLMRRLLRGDLSALWQLARHSGSDAPLRQLVTWIQARGIRCGATAVPLVAVGPRGRDRGWQRLLGAPIDGVPYDSVDIMVYTSLIQGYTRGLLQRRDTVALIDALARRTVMNYGVRARVSLGVVGTGALGDEVTYGSPAELREDVAVARAVGIDDIALFNLGGVLARPPSEVWLDALVHGDAHTGTPPRTLRARALVRVLALAGHVEGVMRP